MIFKNMVETVAFRISALRAVSAMPLISVEVSDGNSGCRHANGGHNARQAVRSAKSTRIVAIEAEHRKQIIPACFDFDRNQNPSPALAGEGRGRGPPRSGWKGEGSRTRDKTRVNWYENASLGMAQSHSSHVL
jgi:hypothetical protein